MLEMRVNPTAISQRQLFTPGLWWFDDSLIKAPISLEKRSWRPWRSMAILQSVAESSSKIKFLASEAITLQLRCDLPVCAEFSGNMMIVRRFHLNFLPRFEADVMRCFSDQSDHTTRLIRLPKPRYEWGDCDTFMLDLLTEFLLTE